MVLAIIRVVRTLSPNTLYIVPAASQIDLLPFSEVRALILGHFGLFLFVICLTSTRPIDLGQTSQTPHHHTPTTQNHPKTPCIPLSHPLHCFFPLCTPSHPLHLVLVCIPQGIQTTPSTTPQQPQHYPYPLTYSSSTFSSPTAAKTTSFRLLIGKLVFGCLPIHTLVFTHP